MTSIHSWAQNGIGIGTTTVDPSAVLEIKSANDNQGLLIPRVTHRANISVTAASKGVMVYDTGDDGFYYFDGSNWLRLVTLNTGLEINMNTNKIINLASGTNNTDAVNKEQMDTADNLQLSKTGGTMFGDIDMTGNMITGLELATQTTDAVSVNYLENALDETLTGFNVKKYNNNCGLCIPLFTVGTFDFNTITNTGIHFGRHAFPYNSPYSGEDHMIFVQEVGGWGQGDNTIYQVAIQLTGTDKGRIKMRNYDGTTWAAWETINE